MSGTDKSALEGEGPLIELEISELSYRGEGVSALSDGTFAFVPHALPTDRVTVRLGEPRGRRRDVEVITHEHRSGRHVDPACARYDVCSGCALRHISLADEREFKTRAVVETLARQGLDAGAVPMDWVGVETSAPRSGYRRRGRFRVEVDATSIRVGLRALGLRASVADIRECPVQSDRFTAHLLALLDTLEAAHAQAATSLSSLRAVNIWTGSEASVLVVLESDVPCGEPLRTRLVEHAQAQDLALGWSVNNDLTMLRGEALVGVGYRVLTEPELRVPVRVPWTSWYHPNPQAAVQLTSWVAAQLPEQVDTLLDLCSGTGMLAVALAGRCGHIISVDEDYRALEGLVEGLRAAGIEHVTPRAGRVGTILRKLRRSALIHGGASWAIINPMRRPLGAQLDELAALGLAGLVYLGPSLGAAAKDAARLCRSGRWRLLRCAAINLYPGTWQTMAGLVLSPSA